MLQIATTLIFYFTFSVASLPILHSSPHPSYHSLLSFPLLISLLILPSATQGGWMAANAALGYLPAELSAGKNIVSDLQKIIW